MSTYISRHYGVTMSVMVNHFPGCCGARSLSGFTVQGATDTLTVEQKHKIYDDLFRGLVGDVPGVLIAADALLDFGEWDDSELERSVGTADSSWVTDENSGCGDISLEDFCKYHEFAVVGESINRNSGNIVAAMVKAVRAAPVEGSRGVDPIVYCPDAPDFSDEPKPEAPQGSADTAAIIESLRRAVAAA